jgi:hypothetical protein
LAGSRELETISLGRGFGLSEIGNDLADSKGLIRFGFPGSNDRIAWCKRACWTASSVENLVNSRGLPWFHFFPSLEALEVPWFQALHWNEGGQFRGDSQYERSAVIPRFLSAADCSFVIPAPG